MLFLAAKLAQTAYAAEFAPQTTSKSSLQPSSYVIAGFEDGLRYDFQWNKNRERQKKGE